MIKPPKDLSKTFLITHGGCMDGSGCSIMFRRAGGRQENIRYVPAGGLEEFWDTFTTTGWPSTDPEFVIIADVGLSDRPGWERYADDMERRGNVVILDHHLTSKHLGDRSFCDIDMSVCATELTRRYLGLETAFNTRLAEIINDNDLWIRKIPDSQRLGQLSIEVGQEDFIERFLWRHVQDNVFSDSESQLLQVLENKTENSIRSALERVFVRDRDFRNDVGDLRTVKVGYVITSEMNVSLLLSRLLAEYPEVKIACAINFDRQSVSLRSRADYDVTGFAKYFGGGGHAQASGHGIPSHVIRDIIEVLHG